MSNSKTLIICPCCGNREEGKMRDLKERYTLGSDLCMECKLVIHAGYHICVICDKTKSKSTADGSLIPEEVHRTGIVIHIQKDWMELLLDQDLEDKDYSFGDESFMEYVSSILNNNPTPP